MAENDHDDVSNKMLVLFKSILHFKHTVLRNCYIKKESSSGCRIHCFLFFVRNSKSS